MTVRYFDDSGGIRLFLMNRFRSCWYGGDTGIFFKCDYWQFFRRYISNLHWDVHKNVRIVSLGFHHLLQCDDFAVFPAPFYRLVLEEEHIMFFRELGEDSTLSLPFFHYLCNIDILAVLAFPKDCLRAVSVKHVNFLLLLFKRIVPPPAADFLEWNGKFPLR